MTPTCPRHEAAETSAIVWRPMNSVLLACLAWLTCGCGGANDKPPAASAAGAPSGAPVAVAPAEQPPAKSPPIANKDVEEERNTESPKAPPSAPPVVEKPSRPDPPAKQPAATAPAAKPATRPAETRPADEADAAARLEKQLAEFKVPPDWLSSVTTNWDVAGKPWKDARVEIRRLLGKNDEASRREGIKLTWEYLQKKDIGNGHEYGMYMFLGNEPLWAIIAYRERVNQPKHDYPPYFGLKALASLYADHGLFEEGEKMLARGLGMAPPKAEWRVMRKAEMHDAIGDHYAAWGKVDKAKASYLEAMRLFPTAKPPYGRHLLPRRVKKIQSKLDMLTLASLKDTELRDGTFRETALGYSGDIKLTVKVVDGRIADIGVRHQEKIDQNACKLIPQRIIEKQSLQVDGISGATVTKNAIVGGTLRALAKAGLK